MQAKPSVALCPIIFYNLQVWSVRQEERGDKMPAPEATVDEILEDMKALPPEQQEKMREALNLLVALFLMGQMSQIMEKTLTLMPDDMRHLRDVLNTFTLDIAGSEGRAKMVRSVRGKYAHLPTGSAAFAARKAEEIRLEDRRGRS